MFPPAAAKTLRRLPRLSLCCLLALAAAATTRAADTLEDDFFDTAKGKRGKQKIGADMDNPLVGTVKYTVVRKKKTVISGLSLAANDPKRTVTIATPYDELGYYLFVRPREGGSMALWGEIEIVETTKNNVKSYSARLAVKGYREAFKGTLKIARDKKGRIDSFTLSEAGKGGRDFELELRRKKDRDALEELGDGAEIQVIGQFKGYTKGIAPTRGSIAHAELGGKEPPVLVDSFSLTKAAAKTGDAKEDGEKTGKNSPSDGKVDQGKSGDPQTPNAKEPAEKPANEGPADPADKE